MLRARFCKLLSLIPSLSGRWNVRVTSALPSTLDIRFLVRRGREVPIPEAADILGALQEIRCPLAADDRYGSWLCRNAQGTGDTRSSKLARRIDFLGHSRPS